MSIKVTHPGKIYNDQQFIFTVYSTDMNFMTFDSRELLNMINEKVLIDNATSQ